MKYIAKKLLCFMLAALAAFGIVPEKANAIEFGIIEGIIDDMRPEDYGILSVPEEVSASKVAERLEKLRLLSGSYFTADGEPCVPAPGEWVHGCTNCETTNIIERDILDLMPENRGCLPNYHLYNGTMSRICMSCAAFATVAHWYLYAGKATDSVTVDKIASGTFSKETLANAKPGDIIALSSVSTGRHYHSMIFIEHTAGGIKVIESNWSTQKNGNCYVSERTVSYSSSYYVAVSRASNAEEEEVRVTGIEILNAESGEIVDTLRMAKNSSVRLAAEIYPSDAANKTVTWSSSDASVAKVSPEGVVTAVGAGEAEITAEAADGGLKDVCTVWVKNTYAVSYDANGGENAPETQTKTEGETLVLSTEKPTREGFDFIGWAEFAEAKEAGYLPGGNYDKDENITLYAVWKVMAEDFIYGDVNGDGKVNISDANYVRRYSAKLVEIDESRMEAADVSGDGKVNIIDANLIRRYAVKLINIFPVEG